MNTTIDYNLLLQYGNIDAMDLVELNYCKRQISKDEILNGIGCDCCNGIFKKLIFHLPKQRINYFRFLGEAKNDDDPPDKHTKTGCYYNNCSLTFYRTHLKDGVHCVNKANPNDPKCYFCQIYYSNEHVFEHKCDICYMSLPNCSILFAHLKQKHNSEKPYFCVVCGFSYIKLHHLQIHAGKHAKKFHIRQNEAYKCPYCDRTFSHGISMRRHISRVCLKIAEKTFKCTLCPKEFFTNWLLKNHMNSHKTEKPFLCEICNKRFTQQFTLKVHLQKHNGTGQHKCDICGIRFLKRSLLKIHADSHLKQTPYPCNICSNNYPSMFHVNKHMQEDHFNEQNLEYMMLPYYIVQKDESSWYQCKGCNKQYSFRSSFWKHKSSCKTLKKLKKSIT